MVLLLLAPSARGEEGAAAEPGAAGADAGENRFLFELGWDDGLTYAVGKRTPERAAEDATGFAKDVTLRGRWGARLALDGGYLAGDAQPDGWQAAMRRFRLYTQGALQFYGTTEYKIQFAVEGTDFFLNDFYFRWRFQRWIDYLRIGYFDPPVSPDALASSEGRTLMESATPVAAFAPSLRSGIEAGGSFTDPSIAWTFNLSSFGQKQSAGDASLAALRLTGRLVWRPLWNPEAPLTTDLLHLGISSGYALSSGGEIQHRARPESFLAPYLVDTGDIRGDEVQVASEFAFRRGRMSLQAELFTDFATTDDYGDLVFWGAYAQASLSLTGEARPYDTGSSTLGRIVPQNPYLPFRGGWGGWEVSGRLAWLDLSDGELDGGRMLTLDVGPTWTWNRFVRWQAGYVFAAVGDRPGGRYAHVIQARFELRF